MMYRNRTLVAQADLHLGTDYVTKGASFAATDTDADYLISQKKAVEQSAEPSTLRSAPPSVAAEPDAAWESRALGADEAHVVVADASHEAALADALGLSRDHLLTQAEAIGLKVDKRWGDERLAAEIAKA